MALVDQLPYHAFVHVSDMPHLGVVLEVAVHVFFGHLFEGSEAVGTKDQRAELFDLFGSVDFAESVHHIFDQEGCLFLVGENLGVFLNVLGLGAPETVQLRLEYQQIHQPGQLLKVVFAIRMQGKQPSILTRIEFGRDV